MSSTSDDLLPEEPLPDAFDPLTEDFEKQLLRGLVQELLRRIASPRTAAKMSAQELNLIRQLSLDNSINFASIKRGDFGATAQRVAEDFPFDENGNVIQLGQARGS